MANKLYIRQGGRATPISAGQEAADGDGLIVFTTTKGTADGTGGADGAVHRRIDGADTQLQLRVDSTWHPLLYGPMAVTSGAVALLDSAGAVTEGPEIGTAANNLVQLDGSSMLPAVDASQLINVPNEHTHTNKALLDDIDQDLATTATVEFAGATVNGRDVDDLIEGPASTTLNNVPQWTAAGLLTDGLGVGTSPLNLIQLDGSGLLPAVDASQLLNVPGGLSVRKTVTQNSHGFVVGDWLKNNGNSAYAKAQANNTANAGVVGVVEDVLDPNTFVLTTDGFVSGLAVPNLTAGTVIYLDPITAGGVTSTKPTTTDYVVVPLAVVLHPQTTMFISYNLRLTTQQIHSHSNLANLATINQNLGTSNSPAFAGLTVGGNSVVAGPATTSANRVPQWDSTTRLLKNGLTVGTAIGNLIVLQDVGGNAALPAVDGSQLSNVMSGPISSTDSAFALFDGVTGDVLKDGPEIGTTVGDIVQLEDVGGGTPGLPAVDGSQLLNLPSAGGDVVGPASATNNALAQYDGITGKLIKNGPSLGTAANNVVQLNGSAQLPAVDGSLLTNIPNTQYMTLPFSYVNLTDSLSDVDAAVPGAGLCVKYVMPFAGSVVAFSANISQTLAAGTVDLEVAINGTEVGAALDLQLTNAVSEDFATVSAGTETFSAGDEITVRVTSDGSISPSGRDLAMFVVVQI